MQAHSSVVAVQFDDLEQQHDTDQFGMWVFLCTEALLFGGLFTCYAAYRIWYSYDFEVASRHLNVLIGAINTFVLLASSLTMALSVHAARTGQQRTLTRCLIWTAVLGTLFLVFKAYEYYTDYRDNLIPGTSHFLPEEWTSMSPPVNPTRVQLFLLFYYIMTGIHAVHLLIGIGLVIWLVVKARRLLIPPERYIDVEVTGLYWHFVDLIWIILLPLLYLIGTHGPADLHF